MQKNSLAIVMSGHMRSFKLTSLSFNKLKESLSKKYKCKLFIHTWDISDALTSSYYERPNNFHPIKINYDLINNIYNPDSILIEKQNIINDNNILHNQSLSGLFYSEYSKYKANELKLNYNENFDYTLCVRPDIHFYNYNIPFIHNDELNVCSVKHNSAASDVIYFSSSNTINKIRDYYFIYKKYLYTYNLLNNEAYFYKFLDDNNIKYNFINYFMPNDWKIVRSWWNSVDEYENDRLTWDKYYDK